ncbi:hypothetical protein GGR08_001188 [Bartonella fuyuanensis]|uniref:Uncharacterized protein n=1 Tax=Bartonella fuyuanensis TaxID=1460968 RepID=A0A840E1M1_9HYPH|nr:hypothetical protein [Bartonella fuyuanensis]
MSSNVGFSVAGLKDADWVNSGSLGVVDNSVVGFAGSESVEKAGTPERLLDFTSTLVGGIISIVGDCGALFCVAIGSGRDCTLSVVFVVDFCGFFRTGLGVCFEKEVEYVVFEYDECD